MKRMLAVAVLVSIAVSSASTQMAEQTKSGKTSVEQELMQMERDVAKATVNKDGATLDRIVADDWVGQGPTGSATKAQAIPWRLPT